jgi:hypothetical protein
MQFWQQWRQRRREAHRDIFSYWDGQKQRRADPLKIARALDGHKTLNLQRDLPLLDAGDPEATGNVVNSVLEVFGCQAWSESTPGLTMTEALDLLNSFCEYGEELKKKRNPSQTFTPPMDRESSTQSDSGTQSMSDFGPTSTESNCAAQAG